MSAVGDFLNAKRLEAKVSKESLGYELGHDSSDIVLAWEVGLCDPPLDKLQIICQVLNLDERLLFDLILRTASKSLEVSSDHAAS